MTANKNNRVNRGTQRPLIKQILPRIFYYLRTAETTAGDLLIHVEILMLI